MIATFFREPKPSRLFHYTSVESLAYILKSRRLRFSRLDKFDDVHEAQKISGYNFGAMLFASSWVAKPEETYPQWAMYGDGMKGVRISLAPQPFEWTPYVPQSGDFALDTCVPMPMEEAITDDYKLVPFMAPGDFLNGVKYVPDVAELWRRDMHIDGGKLLSHDPRRLALYKNQRWSFQEEHRFVMMAHGRPRAGVPVDTSRPLVPTSTYIDVPLGSMAFDELKVELGPLRSEASRLIVGALLEKYAPGAELAESALFGEVRARGA